MIENSFKTQLLICIVTLLGFFNLIKLIINNISFTNDEGETLINLNKMGSRHRSNEK